MRYFVQGLRPKIRETVLSREPKSFHETEEIARLTSAVKTTMSSPLMGVTCELNHPAGTSETSLSNCAPLAKIEEIREKLQKTKELSDTNLLTKFDALIGGFPGNPSNQQPPELQTKLEKLLEKVSRKFDGSHVRDGNTGNIAAFSEASNREKPELLKEIRRITGKRFRKSEPTSKSHGPPRAVTHGVL